MINLSNVQQAHHSRLRNLGAAGQSNIDLLQNDELREPQPKSSQGS